ncbi:MAG: hypothetical protein Q4C50_04155 [Eubacteriales bacterium]|nr:hypothetical protein [Eubacteriales bacterium]
MTNQAIKRRKMIALMEEYLEAMIEKRPDSLPLADNCRVTYNGKEGKAGDNELWKNTLLIKERQTFIDPVTEEMVFFGIMTNETREMNEYFPIDVHVYVKQYLTTVRLKVENEKITEVEELVMEGRFRHFYSDIESVALPALEFEMTVPEEERSTREELIQLVSDYWDAAAGWKKPEELVIHPDAQRYENGYRTTNHSNSFRGDFKHNPSFRWDTPEASRIYPVVDPVRGLVVSSCFMENGAGSNRDGLRGARIVEAFKIKDGAICSLLAFFPVLEGLTGWEK